MQRTMRRCVVAVLAAFGLFTVGMVATRAEPVDGPQFIQPFPIPASEKGEIGEADLVVRFKGASGAHA